MNTGRTLSFQSGNHEQDDTTEIKEYPRDLLYLALSENLHNAYGITHFFPLKGLNLLHGHFYHIFHLHVFLGILSG